MVTSKKKKKGNKVEFLDEKSKDAGVIEATIQVKQLVMKDLRWKALLVVGSILPKSFYKYKIKLQFDEDPYKKRMKDLEIELDVSLFKNERGSQKALKKKISEIKNEMEKNKSDCYPIEFSAVVEEIKYKEGYTVMMCRIPDDIIEPINKQKLRIDAYKIILDPVFEEK